MAVKDRRLIIRPFFPFNMMFLPEIYGLEYEVGLAQITSAERESRSGVRLKFRDMDGVEQDVTVSVRDRDRFLTALRQ